MKQITYRLENYRDFKKFVAEVKASDNYKNAKTVLFKIMTAQFPDSDSKSLYAELRKNFPNAKTVGISMTRMELSKLMNNDATPEWAK